MSRVRITSAQIEHREGIGNRNTLLTMDASNGTLDVDLVIPVLNEERVLRESVSRLHRYATSQLKLNWRITIVDNGSTDATPQIAAELAESMTRVHSIALDRKGRGYALKTAWGRSGANVLAYLDVDLSTDLAGLPPLLAPLLSAHSDLAIGTRLTRTSRVIRGTKREFISRSYNGIVRTVLSASFSDAQCGFKAIRREAAARLLPLVQDDAWFFDTELLVLAERSGMRIHEIPVDWIDDPDSRVNIRQTAVEDLKGLWRLTRDLNRHRLPVEIIAEELGRGPLVPGMPIRFWTQVIRFGAVGLCSTLAFALLFLVFHPLLGSQAANFLALLLTTLGNTWANRWFTFGVTGRVRAVRHQAQGLVVFAIAWSITAGSLIALHTAIPNASALEDILTLTAANILATIVRFVLLRGWVFRTRRAVPRSATSSTTSERASAPRSRA